VTTNEYGTILSFPCPFLSSEWDVISKSESEPQSLEHDPGPNRDKRTGRRRRPCNAAIKMTKNITLKKVIKIYEGATKSAITPNTVDTAPCTIGRPKE
jgi:hypothetical protein